MGIHVQAPSVTLDSLSPVLSRFIEKPVINMRGLGGAYDIKLTFAPESTQNLPPAGAHGEDGKDCSPNRLSRCPMPYRSLGLSWSVAGFRWRCSR